MTKTVKIVEPALCVAMYEVEKLIKAGYSISQTHEPIFIAGLYDIEMVKDEAKESKFDPVITEGQGKKLDDAGIEGIVVPVVNGEVPEGAVEKAVEVATKPRGRKPKASE